MRLSIAKRIQASHSEIEAIVRAAFATVDHRHTYVKVKGRDPDVSWLILCKDPDGCDRINYATIDTAGHHSSSRKRALEVAGDPSLHHPIERRERHRPGVSGRAYNGVPSIANVPRSTRYLVTLHMPTIPERTAEHYPRTRVYGEGTSSERKTSPPIEVRSWQEELFAVAAHEAKHVEQFKERLPTSENRAERHALRSLKHWRKGET